MRVNWIGLAHDVSERVQRGVRWSAPGIRDKRPPPAASHETPSIPRLWPCGRPDHALHRGEDEPGSFRYCTYSTGRISSQADRDGMAETILSQDPHVHACLMFGRGRLQNGILVQPTEEFDPRDEVRLEEFRNQIWCVGASSPLAARAMVTSCANSGHRSRR